MDVATLMSGAAAIAPAWDAQAIGRNGKGPGGPQIDRRVVPALKLDAERIARPDKRHVDHIEAMRDAINKSGRNRLQIDRADNNGRFIYRILNPDTGETMRQWPPERYLELVAYLDDKRGGLMDKTA